MKLLYLHTFPVESEKANIIHVLHMCQAFAEHGINVTLAVPESKNGSTDIEKIVFDCLGRKESFSFVFFKKYMFQGRFNTLGAFWGLKHLLKTHPADICYVRTPLSFSLALSFDLSTISCPVLSR